MTDSTPPLSHNLWYTHAQTLHSPAVPMETAAMSSFICPINGCPQCDVAPNISDLKLLIEPSQLWFHACISVYRVAMQHPVGLCFTNGQNTQPGTHFTGPLHWLGPCMLLAHLIWLDLLGNAQKHETWLKHDHFHRSLSLIFLSLFLSHYPCSSFISSCFLSSHSSASRIVTVRDKWGIMSNMERGRMRLMGLWNTVSVKVSQQSMETVRMT